MTEQKTVHLTIKGFVQGVGYRWFVSKTAKSLDLSGWVRNLDDGDVEAEVFGQSEKIELFIEKIRNNHPYAKVNEIEITENNYKSPQNGEFEIID